MVDIELLKKTITDSGIPKSTIAERAGLKRETLYNKLDNPDTIRVNDIDGLTKALNLTQAERNRIFFAKNVELNSTKGEER